MFYWNFVCFWQLKRKDNFHSKVSHCKQWISSSPLLVILHLLIHNWPRSLWHALSSNRIYYLPVHSSRSQCNSDQRENHRPTFAPLEEHSPGNYCYLHPLAKEHHPLHHPKDQYHRHRYSGYYYTLRLDRHQTKPHADVTMLFQWNRHRQRQTDPGSTERRDNYRILQSRSPLI